MDKQTDKQTNRRTTKNYISLPSAGVDRQFSKMYASISEFTVHYRQQRLLFKPRKTIKELHGPFTT